MKITTLTLNPAYDIHVKIPDFRAGRENLAESSIRSIGGKGINISRALSANGIENLALIVLGEENSDDYIDELKAENLDFHEFSVPGRIRENFTIHLESGIETRLCFRGFECEASLLIYIEAFLCRNKINLTGQIVTFTGSLPAGISPSAAEDFLNLLKIFGAKLVIDSKSITPDALLRIKPWLIKPNSEEIEAFTNTSAPTTEQLYETAASLASGGIENVMISLGGDGAILACGDEIYRARVPKIDALSTIGAGDSTIAGFIASFAKKESASERLRLAVSYGTAACLTEGTNPPKPVDIARIYNETAVERVK